MGRVPDWVKKTELITLFFVHGMALGMWFVPLTMVLSAHGFDAIKPFAFATTAVAAFVSPLIFGAMADRHASPVRVLRGLGAMTAVAMAIAATAIHLRWNPWLVLGLIQFHAICSAPAFSISSTIVLTSISQPRREFGPIRAMATLGWMAGCWLISALGADQSAVAAYAGALAWLILAGFTLVLPEVPPPPSAGPLSVAQRLGLDALALLRQSDTRVIFLTTALFAIPLASFYPYSPPHLRELGFDRTSAWMSLGQVSEILAMFAVAGLMLRWRLKWILAAGLGFGVLRFALCAMDGPRSLLAGISLHGCSFTLVFITAQIYLNERVDPAWRARAQALLTFMMTGVGNLTGYLGGGWWFAACTIDGRTRWPMFWSALSIAVAAVLIYFLIAYRGRGSRPTQPISRGTPVEAATPGTIRCP